MKRIAIIGASGFVGSYVVERLFSRDDCEIVPLIHSSGNAWRITRLGIKPLTVNLLLRCELEQALFGCTHVINCSRGAKDVMFSGLQNLLAVSQRNKVQQFVHLSSVMVYGDPPTKASEFEDAPTKPAKGSYGWIKLQQDRMVRKACRAGLRSVILCPPNISGPYSPFLIQILQTIKDRRLVLMDNGSAPCNLVDVSNLVHAIESAIDYERGDAERMFITDNEETTWYDLINHLEPLAELKEPLPVVSEQELRNICKPKSISRVSILKAAKHLVSSDVRVSLRKDPLWSRIDDIMRRGAGILGKKMENRLRLSVEGPISPGKVNANSFVDVRRSGQQLRGVRHSNSLAKRELAYRPLISFSESMKAFVAWYRAMHYMESREWELLSELSRHSHEK